MPKTVTVTEVVEMRPTYIPVPAIGARCPHTNLSRDQIMSLITGRKPPVRCLEIRADNGKIVKRLVKFDSLIAYLDRELEKQEAEKA